MKWKHWRLYNFHVLCPCKNKQKMQKNTNETGSDLSLGVRLTKVKRYCKSQALSLHNTETLPWRWSSHYLVSHWFEMLRLLKSRKLKSTKKYALCQRLHSNSLPKTRFPTWAPRMPEFFITRERGFVEVSIGKQV